LKYGVEINDSRKSREKKKFWTHRGIVEKEGRV
jgi:hypothetical protein